MIQDLIAGYIQYKNGGSVSRQFVDSFSGAEGFEEQNINALKYIKEDVQNVLEAEILKDEWELKEYFENLKDYLSKKKLTVS